MSSISYLELGISSELSSIRILLLPNFILSCNSYQIFFRFYTHDQALEAIYQAQKMVLGDNLLKVSTGSGKLLTGLITWYILCNVRNKLSRLFQLH